MAKRHNDYYHKRKNDPEFKARKSASAKASYHKNKKVINAAQTRRYQANKVEINEQKKNFRKLNPEIAKENYRRYRTKNKEAIETRRLANVNGIIAKRLRNRMRKVLIKMMAGKTSSVLALIGCDINTLRLHLESKFLPGMSWERRSEIHIDHRMPCASFNLSDPTEQQKCFHYTNLQPLWASDNLSKGKSIIQL